MCSCKGIYFAAALFTLLLIPDTPSAAFNTPTTPTSIEGVGVYSAIAVSACVNIVRKQVAKIVKDI